MKTRVVPAIVLTILLTLAWSNLARAEPEVSTGIEIYPEEKDLFIDDTFTVDINITDVIDLSIFQFVLRYDRNILQVIDVVPGEFLGELSLSWHLDRVNTGVPTIFQGFDCDVNQNGFLDVYDLAILRCYFSWPVPPGPWSADINNDGVIDLEDIVKWSLAMSSTFIDMPGAIQFFSGGSGMVSGSGTVATVTFTAIGSGETLLDLDKSKLSDWCGEPIPHWVKDGTVSVFTPVEAIQDLTATIESWDLPKGAENSLTHKLEEALDLLDKDNVVGAVQKLGDFTKYVEAMRGKKLTDEETNYLIARTEAIINVIA